MSKLEYLDGEVLQKHLIKNGIVIGMGAGLVSKHMRSLKESL